MAVGALLLDTNAYAAFKRGVPDAVEVVRNATLIGISGVVLGELLGGFAAGTREAANREDLGRFLSSERVIFIPVDADTAEQYAFVYAQLRQAGRPIPTNDMWIAATALQHGFAIFSYDAHFQFVKGVSVGKRLVDF